MASWRGPSCSGGLEARPDEGTGVGPGWVLCPICDGDFYVHVRIERDVIVGVDVDFGRPGAGGRVPPAKEPEQASEADTTELTKSEVLRFLRANQPLPDDGELQAAELRALSDVVRFLSENQLDEAVPLLLRVFGEGSGFGVYQLVEGAVVRQRRDLVVTELGRALSEPQGNPYWLLHAATAVPDVSFRDEVVRLCGHEDADIRCAAISALEAIGDAVAWQVLRHRMKVETDPHVYEALVDALRAGGA